MFLRLFLLFTLVPLVELYLLITIGTYLGAGPTILLVLGTGMAGAYLARLEGWRTWRKIQTESQRGVTPANELIDGVLILAAGVLLITPRRVDRRHRAGPPVSAHPQRPQAVHPSGSRKTYPADPH